MPDLKTRFRGAERISTPDLWPDITSREPRARAPEPGLPRRALVATLALAVAVAGVAFAIRAFEGQTRRRPIAPAPGSANGVIAYASIGEQKVFWTINPDGSDRTRVHIDVPGFVSVPSWSPDGTRIAFDVTSFEDPHPEGGNFDIYVANADGTYPVRLTFENVDHDPVWSPDGTKIAYVHGWDDQAQIWVMNADGSDPHPLTDARGPNLFPSWSPDGATIAFVSFEGANSDIYVMNADGSKVRRLTTDPAHEDQPAWSPDGRQIAFTSERRGSPGIYVTSPDGGGVTQLLADPDPANLGFAWSPDGTTMAVVSIRGPGHDRNVYVLDVATGELTGIGESGAFYGPSWQPVRATEATPTRMPTPSPVSTAEIGPTIDIGQASALAYADGSVWVNVLRDAATSTGTVLRVDPSSGEILARIPVDAYPDSEHGGGGMVFDGRYLWVVGTRWSTDGVAGGILVRIDPAAETAETIDLPVGATGTDLVFDDGFLWTTGVSSPGKDPRVLQIDPLTGAVVSETPIDAEWWSGLVVEAGAVWVTEMSARNSTVRGNATFVRLEPGTGAVLAQAPAVDESGAMGSTIPVATEGAIWVPTGSELLELDPQTGEAFSRFDLAVGGDFEPAPDRSLWCLCGFGWNELQRLDPNDGTVDVTVHLDRRPIPTAIAVAPDSVWVLAYDGTLTRVALR